MIGKTSRKAFVFIIAILLLYLFILEPVLHASMLGPLGEFEGREYYECKRFCNFDSGEELAALVEEMDYLREEEFTNTYIIDFSDRWATLYLSFQRCNQIILEYQMDENRFQQTIDYLLQNGFQRKHYPSKNDHEKFFGDFQFYYRVENNNLQTLVAVNPVDNTMRITCFRYSVANSKSGSDYILFFRRITETPSAEFNLNNLFYSMGNSEKWKTKQK